ncbi:MAG: hypothetical protein AAFZ01_01315 [Pseudomonadota bacterium]
MKPVHISPVQWDHAVGYARQSCARIFRHGGSPVDAMSSFGLTGGSIALRREENWGGAVQRIALALCAPTR